MDKNFLQQSLLVQHFRVFYQELVRLKGYALSSSLLSQKKKEDPNAAQYIFNRLVELLSQNRKAALEHQNKAASAYYDDALYIMAALADEIFLRLTWSGKQAWNEHLLEVHFFNTHKAGDHLFEKLDTFLKANNATAKDLATLYLWALGLNFLGKYDAPEHAPSLEQYKKNLYALIYHGSSKAIAPAEVSLVSPSAYKNIISGARPSHLPSIQFWFRCLYAAIGGMLLISSALWRYDMSEIRSILNATHVVKVAP